MKRSNRREFLKQTGLLAAGLSLGFPGQRLYPSGRVQSFNSRQNLGRVFAGGATSRREPSPSAEAVKTYNENEVLELLEPLYRNTRGASHALWYRLGDGGYLPATDIQPVKYRLNAPNLEVGSSGRLVEISVPFTDAWSSAANRNKPNQIFFYGTLHWAYGLGQDEEKNYYYLIREDRWGDVYYVDATHARVISEEELQPISLNLSEAEKTIRINLAEQFLIAYENKTPVFMSPIASGLLSGNVNLTTPKGSFIINYKRPSRHMAHGERFGSNGGELFGVPWVSYFTDTGIAFHGTYWHNDFTRPKSHGCINMPIAAAKWLYLWSYPVITPRQEKHVSQTGSPVEIL